MVRMSREGLFYFHIVLITFSLIIFIILKNFNLDDYKDTEALSTTQISFIYILFIIGLIVTLLFLIRGYTIKTPEWGTRGAVALIFIVLGLAIFVGALLHDRFLVQDEEIRGLESLLMCFGALIGIAGSFLYNSIKFEGDRQDRLFIRAVREGLETVRASTPPTPARRSRRVKRGATAVQPMYPPPMHPQTEAPSGDYMMGEAHSEGSEMKPETLVKCVRCKRMLKLTSDKRPVTIKCPYCEAIGVIKD